MRFILGKHRLRHRLALFSRSRTRPELHHRLKRLTGIAFKIAACDEVRSVLADGSMGRNISEGIRTELNWNNNFGQGFAG